MSTYFASQTTFCTSLALYFNHTHPMCGGSGRDPHGCAWAVTGEAPVPRPGFGSHHPFAPCGLWCGEQRLSQLPVRPWGAVQGTLAPGDPSPGWMRAQATCPNLLFLSEREGLTHPHCATYSKLQQFVLCNNTWKHPPRWKGTVSHQK